MLVHCDVIDGIEYEIHTVPIVGDDWKSTDRGKFYAVCDGYGFKLYSSYADCAACVKYWITEQVSKTPNTTEELVVELSTLLVWEDYEVCNFDTKRAYKLIQNFLKKHYERKD